MEVLLLGTFQVLVKGTSPRFNIQLRKSIILNLDFKYMFKI